MATVEKFLGDPYETREVACEKMLDMIGRDASDLDFTISGGTDGADVEYTDPDVRLAWNALAEVYAQVMTRFWYFNTIEDETIEVASSQYTLPDQFGQDDARQPTTSGVSAVRITEQPSDLDLIFRNETGTDKEALFDRLSNSNTGFAGKGDVKCEIAFFINWDVIPFFVKQFIVLEAALKFAKRATASTAIVDMITEDRDRARLLLTGIELESRAPNALRDGMLTAPGITDRFPF